MTTLKLNDYSQNRFNLKLSKNLAKLLLTVGIVVCTETYVNDSSWYRIYSDGWCEQGGSISTGVISVTSAVLVTFLKPYIDHQYTITLIASHKDTNNSGSLQLKYANQYFGCYYRGTKLAQSIKLCGYGTWHACGYIA